MYIYVILQVENLQGDESVDAKQGKIEEKREFLTDDYGHLAANFESSSIFFFFLNVIVSCSRDCETNHALTLKNEKHVRWFFFPPFADLVEWWCKRRMHISILSLYGREENSDSR